MVNVRKYIDFQLFLSGASADGDRFQVSLLPIPELGESSEPVPFSTSEGAYVDFAPMLVSKMITLRYLVMIGKQLADWLLPAASIRPLFIEALKKSGREGGVRIKLIIADPVLKQIPWEYIFFDPLDPNGEKDSTQGFLALNPQISIVRYEPLPMGQQPHDATNTLQALNMVVATSSPTDMHQLAIGQEVKNLEAILTDKRDENIKIQLNEVVPNATLEELETSLKKRAPVQVFHFAGHGSTESVPNAVARGNINSGFLHLIEDKETLTSARVAATHVANALKMAGVLMVTLGACDSGQRDHIHPWHSVAGALLAANIPVVVAMQNELIDTESVTFSQAFYESLGIGLSLDEAMSWSRIKLAGTLAAEFDRKTNVEWGVPVLYSRLPDGILAPQLVETGAEATSSRRDSMQSQIDHRIEIHNEQIVDEVTSDMIGNEIGSVNKDVKISSKQVIKSVKGGTVVGNKINNIG